MAENHPVCVLRVNLQGCQIHPEKVNKELQKINGVYTINIDTKEGLVIIAGLVDPPLLIETIQKLGIETQLLAYEKNPTQVRKKLNHYLKKMQIGNAGHSKGKKINLDKVSDQSASPLEDNKHSADGDHHNTNTTGYAHYMRPHGSPWQHPSYGMESISAWPRPQPNYAHVHPLHLGPMPNMLYMKSTRPPLGPMPNTVYMKSTRPPLPYPYDIYGDAQEPDVGNASHHFFSDENVRACHIM